MIEFVNGESLKEVLSLIRAYQEFYEVSDIDDDRNEIFFSDFGEHNPFGCQFLYRGDGCVVAFATVYFTFTSTIAKRSL